MISISSLPHLDRLILLGAGSVIILAGIKMAAWFIGPLLLSTFIAIIFPVLAKWMMSHGISLRVANALSFSVFLGCLIFVIALIFFSPTHW